MAIDFHVKFGGKDYNIQKFMRHHPGGVNTLRHYKNRSVESAMEKFGHSNAAYHLLKDFRVPDSDDEACITGGVSANGRILTKEESGRSLEEIEFLEELEVKIDWSQPILSQLHKVQPHYAVWVNTAVFKRCRLFSSSLLELVTFTPWYVVPAVWLPAIVWLLYACFMRLVLCGDSCPPNLLTTWEFAYHVLTGACSWPLVEYTLHRFVLHGDPGENIYLTQLHFLFHGLHHKVPFEELRLVFPPVPAAVVTLLMYGILCLIVGQPEVKVAGGLIGYLIYDMIHYYVHMGSPPNGSYLYEMKRYHHNHHFTEHNKAFGISCKFWDIIFSTTIQVKKLAFSLKWS